MPRVNDRLTIENAELLFKNFSGAKSDYNQNGNRTFCVVIPSQELAEKLMEDGWYIKFLKPRNEGDEPKPYMQVKVSYSGRPPLVKTITSSGQTVLDEETIDMLDWADIEKVDLIISQYNWSVNGKTGVKGYLYAMYATIHEDELAKKYANLEDDLPF